MKLEVFSRLAKESYTHIPLARTVLADLDTPLAVYYKLARGPYSYLLESMQGGEKWGRYSFIGLPAKKIIRVQGKHVQLEQQGEVIETHCCEDPMVWINDYEKTFRVPELDDLPRFSGGLVGYFGYDTVRYVEQRIKESTPEDTVGTPDILLLLSEEVAVFDNLRNELTLIVHVDPSHENAYALGQQRLDELERELREPFEISLYAKASAKNLVTEADFVSSFGQQSYEVSVSKIKEYIAAGDVMQVVLAQRMSVPFSGDPLTLYRSLRQLNPSPYMVFMDMEDFHIVSASPEILARVEDKQITVRPLAGTRRRGRNEEEDQLLEADLLADAKEIAEHLMLIDLSRNDAGRVSTIGSVEVTKQMFVERYSHVMHIASTVESELHAELSALDVLKATLPVGTLSGAPKVRALEIIDELEVVKRGIYGGAMGYLSWNGNMDMAIAIRTAVIKEGTLYIQAGAGIVADSDPRSEWEETMNKARAMFLAVQKALQGL
jgi:anthranilate synthase component 1